MTTLAGEETRSYDGRTSAEACGRRGAGGARLARALVALVAASVLSGCSFDLFQSGKGVQYKSASKLPPLEIPPDLTRPGRDERYIVPDTTPGGTATLSTYNAERASQPRTGTGDVLPDPGQVRMQRAGSERWLVVPEPPEKIWPTVKQFWQENGFVLKIDNPESGIMETDWAENRAKIPQDPIRNSLGRLIDSLYSSGERDKFRTRLDRSADGKATEVYITHRGMVEVFVGPATDVDTRWQPRPPDPELEAEFMRRLMVRFGVDDVRAKAALAQGSKTEERARLTKSANGAASLEVLEPFDRAWRRVGVALDRSGFTVEDRDRASGLYYVRYADPSKEMNKPGLLGKLAFWRSDDKGTKAEQYRVQVSELKEFSEIQVLSKDGAPDRSDTSRRILSLLYDQLK
jgi:outer membrane protein assembly factor BamC